MITTDTTTTTGTAIFIAEKSLVSTAGSSTVDGGSVIGGVHIVGVVEGSMTGGEEGVEEGGRDVGPGVSVTTGLSGEGSALRNML